MKQILMDKDDLMIIFKSVLTLIDEIEDAERRDKLNDIFDHIGERFFTAPASGRVTYHNCFPGGLAEHSLRVYRLLKTMTEELEGMDNISHDSVIIVSLLHDLGKIGSVGGDPYYIAQENSWHQEKLGEYYKVNENMLYLGVAQRSLRLLTDFRFVLTEEEYQSILIKDGMYSESNKEFRNKECKLGLLLHHADMIASKLEEEKYLRFINGE
jgi:hypothetical protein